MLKKELQAENDLLRKQTLRLIQERDEALSHLFKAESVLKELKRRFELHQKHFPEACGDMFQAGVKTRQVMQPLFSKVYSQLSLATGFTK